MIRFQKTPLFAKALAVSVAVALVAITPVSFAWGQVYKVTDAENGVVFTDSPQTMDTTQDQSVEKVELKEINTAAPVEVAPPAPASADTDEESREAAAEPTVTIASPADESTIAMGPGNFSVSATATPALSRGERLVLLIDGSPLGEPQSSAGWFVEGALRGPHDLVVQRTTSRGTVIATSESVRIYVLRPSIIGR
ncbi:Ig-like domain-containing protein [Congregibacter sp.]|uniref:Ig-like domain-containing protein n=1 Tax=Congregibacter sp. TaxID=2744308 RepID=UPI003F6A97B3